MRLAEVHSYTWWVLRKAEPHVTIIWLSVLMPASCTVRLAMPMPQSMAVLQKEDGTLTHSLLVADPMADCD